MKASKKISAVSLKHIWSSKAFKRLRFVLLLLLVFSLGTVYGVKSNPKYLAWSEQQAEIKAQVAKESKKIKTDAQEQITQATEAANTAADKKIAEAKKAQGSSADNTNTETKTVEKVVEKKVQYVHTDCEALITRYNYLLKTMELEASTNNFPGISSSIAIGHGNDMQTLAKNCLNNQAYVPKGTLGGRTNQIIWDNWR